MHRTRERYGLTAIASVIAAASPCSGATMLARRRAASDTIGVRRVRQSGCCGAPTTSRAIALVGSANRAKKGAGVGLDTYADG